MKGLRGAMIILLVGYMLQACNNHKAQNYNLAVDTDGDTTPDTSVKLNAVVDTDDRKFALEAITGGVTEVELGKLAVKNGHNKEVKNFGQMMVKDHSKANHKLLMLMRAENIAIPATPNAEQQKLINELAKKSGDDFDKDYVSFTVDDHKKTVQLFTDESKKLQDPELKKFAIKTLPVLKNHLDEISAIYTRVK